MPRRVPSASKRGVYGSVSLGVAPFRMDGEEAEELMQGAVKGDG